MRNKWDSRHKIGIESIKRQHPAYLPRGSRPRKKEFKEIVHYLMTSLPSLRPAEHDFDHIKVGSGIGKSGDDDSGYDSDDEDGPGPGPMKGESSKGDGGTSTGDKEDQTLCFPPTPPPSPPPEDSDFTRDQQQQSIQHDQRLPLPTLNEPTLPNPRKFSFVWVNMADEIHGCNSYGSYQLVAALNRLRLGGRSYSSNSISSIPPPSPLSSHLPSFFAQIRHHFALDKRQREIWDIKMLYIPSNQSRAQQTVLQVSEKTWEGIKGLIGKDEEANFVWRIYTYRKRMSVRRAPGARVYAEMSIIGDRRKKKKEVKFVSSRNEDGDPELLDGVGDGKKRRRIE